MQEKKERNDVQRHIEMFANGIGSQNWWKTRPYRPGNLYNEGTHTSVHFLRIFRTFFQEYMSR